MIGAIIVIGLVAFALWCCCKVAGQADRKMEEIMEKKEYEECVRKYAKDRGISVEEAEEHAIVKSYKEYKENECVGVSK